MAIPAVRVHTTRENGRVALCVEPSGTNSSDTVIYVKNDPNSGEE
jgi:hypothetical protein